MNNDHRTMVLRGTALGDAAALGEHLKLIREMYENVP